MNIERCSHAVAGAVPVVEAQGPQGGACQDVDGATRGALWPHCAVQLDVALHTRTHRGRAWAAGQRPSPKPQAISCKLSCKLSQLAVAAHVPQLPHAEQPLQGSHSAA